MKTPFPFRHDSVVLRHACACVAFAALSTGAFAANDILARVNGTDVKVDEVRPYLENLSSRDQATLENNPAELTQAVRTILTSRVVATEAAAHNWDKDPAFVTQLDKVRQQLLVESYLKSVSEPPADFPSEAELKTAYEANKSALVAPRQVHLAQIIVAIPTGADDAAIKKAQAKLDTITKQLGKAGADFATIARAESDQKQSSAEGGEL
ncbi:MAG: peptidylprolyl isomerase, partial [Chthoniobacteraceae bacterium]|nr:peptidylprolyl isomerase [Chthoniobacteraceae bacterium]